MNTLDIFVKKGREQAEQDLTDRWIHNLIRQCILIDDKIASALEVTANHVADIRKQLKAQ